MVEFTIDNSVKSGTYSIAYDDQSISDTVTLVEMPKIDSVSINTSSNISQNDGVYFVKNLTTTVTFSVKVANQMTGYKIRINNDTSVEKNITSATQTYTVSYSIASLPLNENIEVPVEIIDNQDNTSADKKTVTICRVEPTVDSITIDGAEYVAETDTYYLQKSGKLTVRTVVKNGLSGYRLYLLNNVNSNSLTYNTLSTAESQTCSSSIDVRGDMQVKVQIRKGSSASNAVFSKSINIKIAQTKVSVTGVSDAVFIKDAYYAANDTVSIGIKVENPVPGYNVYVNDSLIFESLAESDETTISFDYTIASPDTKDVLSIQVKKSENGTALASADVSLYHDTKAPIVTVDGVYTASIKNGVYTRGNVISGRWTNSKTVAIVFSISDEGAGLNSELAITQENVSANGIVALDLVEGQNNQYTAYFTLSDTKDIELTVNNLEDAVGNRDESSASIDLGIDTVKPVIENAQILVKDKNNNYNVVSSNKQSKGTFKIRFKVTDADSGLNINPIKNSITVKVGSRSLTVSKSSYGEEYYESDATYINNTESAKFSVIVTDNAGNKQTETFEFVVNNEPSLDGDIIVNISGNKSAVKVGDIISYTLSLKDEDGDTVTVNSFILSIGNTVIKEFSQEDGMVNDDDTVTFSYTIPPKSTEENPTENGFPDDSAIIVSSVTISDGIDSVVIDKPQCDSVKYYDPIKFDDYSKPSITVLSSRGNNTVCANGSDILTFTVAKSLTKTSGAHLSNVTVRELYYKINDSENWIKVDNNDGIYTAMLDITGNNYTDKHIVEVKAVYQLIDGAGNVATSAENPEIKTDMAVSSSAITYYAPISDKNVIIECVSSNEKSKNQAKKYAKENDTLTFSVSANPNATQNKLNEGHTVSVKKVSGLNVDANLRDDGREKVFTLAGISDVGNITFTIEVIDDAGQSFVIEKESNITYYAPITLENISFTSNLRNPKLARRGSNLTFIARASHKVKASNVTVESIAATTVNDETVDLFFEFNGVDGITDEKMFSPAFDLEDAAGNEYEYNNSDPEKELKYYAPITLGQYKSAILSVTSTNTVNTNAACDGNELTFGLDTSKVAEGKTHGVEVLDCELYFSIDGGNTWRKVTDNTATLTHNPDFKDMQKISVKAEYKLVDPAGNEAYDADNPEATLDSDVVYYAPINADNVDITCSSNNKKNAAFAKMGDKLSFDAKVNSAKNMSEEHSLDFDVTVNDMSGLKASQDNKVAEITKDYEDIDNISYNVIVSDAAGQSFTIEKQSNITYYAPITLENISFTSNARDPKYARNGSNLTFTARASHKVEASNVNVESFAATTVNDETVDLRFEFNGVNGIANEKMFTPSFDLEDAAGNVYDHKDHIPEIEYDSATPKVSISPKLNGFLNGNFSCTATFADKNLYPEGMKFEYHAKKANATRSAMDTSSFVDKTTIEFKQSLSLSEEDTYKISASVTDKAGNTSADAGMTVTIDKTAPNITSVKITSDTILIFKKGFVISDYVDIEEEFINELICKVSDSTGTVDWDVDKPIETEGKKTISIVVTDMAGNTSSFDFEVYIDATAPDPVVKDTVTGREMEAGKENKFTKELDLSVLLETPQIPNMLQDEFTTLKLLDADGNEIYDFISKDGLKTDYAYNFNDYGKYVLLVEAKDHAIAKDGSDGNVYGPAKYYITFTDGNIFEVIGDNPILMYSLISLLALALIGGGIFAFIVLAKRKKDKENA